MAPIRRYLRITKYSVLEVRIYLDNPALAQSWLLHPRHNVLPRIMEAVRPLVLPKLREEKERARKKSTKKKGIKDVVAEDDFEVSIFLTETSTRHSLLTKHKHFHDKTQTKLTSASGRSLVGASNEAPIDIDLAAASAPIMLQEEDDQDDIGAALAAIPAAPTVLLEDMAPSTRPKRARAHTRYTDAGVEQEEDADSDLFIASDDGAADVDAESQSASAGLPPPHKRRKETSADGTGGDDKKKLAMDISYEGFSIYGRVLCLVVKRREVPAAAGGSGTVALGAGNNDKTQGQGQAMMENFIISTQIPAGEVAPS
ncbi:hypothetical protein TruAng_003037 [Truncatella angustata]|nr:hypothetical protein TruAng_003037 [Truncatella angustata]